MGFMAVVAFCTAMSAGPSAPQSPYECVWVEQGYAFDTETACMIQTSRVARDPIVLKMVDGELFATYGYNEPFVYFTYCVKEDELKDFYRHFGVSDLDDIPENT